MNAVWRLIAAMAMAAPALAPAASPVETLERFHRALHENDRQTALQQVSPDAVIYEQGFADFTRKAWAGGQLQDATNFARNTQRRTLERRSQQAGDVAWVLSTTQTDGLFEGQVLTLLGTETAILRLDSGEWKIVHLHWSAHEKPPSAAAPAAK